MNRDLGALPAALASAFKWACLSELEAIKPGNVHIFADGHGMVVEDFLQSAEAAASVMTQPGLSVGDRIYAAVEKTWDTVGCNTNLGIILLCAPLAHAALNGTAPTLRERLHETLSGLTVSDAEAAFRAITKAAPAGLGDSACHDVHAQASVTLLHAMSIAQDRDRIAWQYAHGYADIFDIGLVRYRTLLARWQWMAWATTGVYLGFLAQYADTHISRKFGDHVAYGVQQEARAHEQRLDRLDNPKLDLRNLMDFDASLKARGLNPGTSADLTVGTLFAYAVEKAIMEK